MSEGAGSEPGNWPPDSDRDAGGGPAGGTGSAPAVCVDGVPGLGVGNEPVACEGDESGPEPDPPAAVSDPGLGTPGDASLLGADDSPAPGILAVPGVGVGDPPTLGVNDVLGVSVGDIPAVGPGSEEVVGVAPGVPAA